MNYILDSNTVSDIYDKDSENHIKFVERLGELSSEDQVYILILTFYELEYGYFNADDTKKEIVRIKIEEAKSDFTILNLTLEATEHFGKIKKELKQQRKISSENIKKHNIDCMIASSAIIQAATLVSVDKIYLDIAKVIPELEVENWAE